MNIDERVAESQTNLARAREMHATAVRLSEQITQLAARLDRQAGEKTEERPQ